MNKPTPIAMQALFALFAATATATTYTWTPGVSGSWDDATKWSPNGTPAAGDVVQFGGTYNTDTTVTVGNTATVSFPSTNLGGGGGKLILQGESAVARTLTVSNTSDINLNGGPLVLRDLDANITVSGGSRRILMGGAGSSPALLNLDGDSTMTLNSTALQLSGDGNAYGSRVAINDTASLIFSGALSLLQPGRGQNTWGGIVQRGGAVTSGGVITFGNNSNSFGTWEMFAGTNTASTSLALANGAGSKAGLYIHGGKFTFGGNIYLGLNASGRSEVFIDGGEVSFNSNDPIRLIEASTSSTDHPSVLTIAGDASVKGFKLYPYGTNNTYSGQSRAMVNLNGNGLLSLSDTFKVLATGTTRATLSFNGGTLERVTGSPDSDANKQLLTGVDAVVYPGGGKLRARTKDGASSGMNLNSAKFRKAGGWGVASISVTGGGAGYLLPPLVDITGGSGSNATAVAQIDYDTGAVTNVVVTCPGEGYAADDTLSVSFIAPAKPVVTAATATATLAENTAGTLRIVDGSSVALGATFRYDGDFAMDTGTYVQITGNVTLGGTSEFKGLDVRDNATLVLDGPATANDADLKGRGTIVIAEGGSLAISGYASLRGTVEVAHASTTPLITVGSCSFVPATGSSYVATLVPADGLRATEPIPVIAVSGTVTGLPALGGSETERWRVKTSVSGGVTTIWLAPVAPTTIVLR